MFAEAKMSVEEDIKRAVREVRDFPVPGISFKDITPVFRDQKLCNRIVDAFISRMGPLPDAIIGIESRGFLFGFMVANRLDIPFVLMRKAGKLPPATLGEEYLLEYGSSKIEMHADAIRPDWNVMIHDDLLATGGTAAAAARLVNRAGARVSGFHFLVGLEFLEGKKKLLNYSKNITCLVHY